MIFYKTRIDIWFKTAVVVHMLSKTGASNPNSNTPAHLQVKQTNYSSSNFNDKLCKRSSSIGLVLKLLNLNFLLPQLFDNYSWKKKI